MCSVKFFRQFKLLVCGYAVAIFLCGLFWQDAQDAQNAQITIINRAVAAENNYLTAADLSSPLISSLADYVRETLNAALAGRSPLTPADFPAELSGAANGVEISILRDGEIIAQGAAVESTSLPANLRLAAGRALLGFSVKNFAECSLWLTLLDAGKDSPTPAPVLKPVRGANAYQLRRGGQEFFIGTLRPLLNGSSWQETLDLALAEKLPESTPSSRLEFLVSPECKTRVFTAFSLLIPPSPAPAILATAEPVKITAELLTSAWDGLLSWWKQNSHLDGGYANETNPRARLATNAIAAAALGFLWRESRDDEIFARAQKLLAKLLDENFLESPGDDCGYLRASASPANEDLASTIFVFWALELCEQQKNPAFAAKFQLLKKFVARGFYRGEFGGEKAGGTEFLTRINSVAAAALLLDDASANGSAVLKSFDRFADSATLTSIPWRTRALIAAYEATRQKKILAQAVAINAKMIAKFKGSAYPTMTAAIAESLFSVAQVTPMLKILGAAANFPRIETLREWANRALPDLLARQITSASWLAELFPKPADYGGFINSFVDWRSDVATMIPATFALIQTRRDFSLEK